MRNIRDKESILEKRVRKVLWGMGIRYRKNSLKHFGKPDIVIASKKIVIFIDSCFWHGCEKHCRMPQTNRDYWIKKISNNIKRDKLVLDYYENIGWKIVRIWEHDLKDEEEIKKILLNNLMP